MVTFLSSPQMLIVLLTIASTFCKSTQFFLPDVNQFIIDGGCLFMKGGYRNSSTISIYKNPFNMVTCPLAFPGG